MKTDLLKGIRIVDLTTYAAAPGAGRMMADWGADVIKVETFDGDPMRKFGDSMGVPANEAENPIWELENGNKRGVTIDMKNPKGKEVMMKLLGTADAFITNVRLGSLKKMGLDYESLAPVFPKLVWGHVSGYGVYGDEAARPGFDVISYWARGGSLVDFSPIGHPPITPPYGIGDHTASLVLLGGVLGALMRQQRTGQGEKVEVSLYSTAIWVNSLMVISTQYGDQWPKDRYLPSTPFSNTYLCKDGEWITLTIIAYERYWKAFCEAMEIPEVIDDPRFNTLLEVKKPENCKEFCKFLEEQFIKKDSQYWMDRFDAADIAYERAAHYKNTATDKQAIANHYMEPFTMKSGNKFMLPMGPVQFAKNEAIDSNPAPLIGEHNDEVFTSLGYSKQELEELRAAGAIGK